MVRNCCNSQVYWEQLDAQGSLDNLRKDICCRDLVAGIDTMIPISNGKKCRAVNFDNAATTPPFYSVLQSILNFSPWYSSIHRGEGYKSRISSKFYEESRKKVMNFVGADICKDTVIYVKNTTEAINKLSYRLEKYKDRDIILTTLMEHHSNSLPWRDKYHVEYICLDRYGRLDLKDFEHKMKKFGHRVRLVSVVGASNVTGYINPVHKMAAQAHRYGCEILVDGAQLIPHVKFDIASHDSPEHIDYLAFSAHKMYAPFGEGVLIGPKATFEKGIPEYKGGGTIDVVTSDFVKYAEPPDRDEAGTPNLMGVVALGEAIDTLSSVGMETIFEYERSMLEYAYYNLKKIKGVVMYAKHSESDPMVAIIPFNINGIHHTAAARALSYEFGIAVRSGCFCAQPYVQNLLGLGEEKLEKLKNGEDVGYPGMIRMSLGMYNTFDEIDFFIEAVRRIAENPKIYNDKYR